jgi:hypothetical protein
LIVDFDVLEFRALDDRAPLSQKLGRDHIVRYAEIAIEKRWPMLDIVQVR